MLPNLTHVTPVFSEMNFSLTDLIAATNHPYSIPYFCCGTIQMVSLNISMIYIIARVRGKSNPSCYNITFLSATRNNEKTLVSKACSSKCVQRWCQSAGKIKSLGKDINNKVYQA